MGFQNQIGPNGLAHKGVHEQDRQVCPKLFLLLSGVQSPINGKNSGALQRHVVYIPGRASVRRTVINRKFPSRLVLRNVTEKTKARNSPARTRAVHEL